MNLTRDRHAALASAHGFFKADRDRVVQVGPALGDRFLPARAPRLEQVGKQVAER